MTQVANAISPLTRVEIKSNGIIVWKIASESGHTYETTIFEGKVTSCRREDGASCPGFAHRGTCHHATLALAREDSRQPKVEAPKLTTSEKGSLSSNRPFSLMR